MFKSLCIAALVLSVGWLGGWAGMWWGEEYDRNIPVLVHLVYFAALAAPRSTPATDQELPFWVMGALSALAFWLPWAGIICAGAILLVAACSDLWDWWVTPRRGYSVYQHPVYGECLEEDVSPRELDRRKKAAHGQ